MVTKAISWVADEPNLFESEHGQIFYINGSFHDGDTFSIGSKDQGAALNHRSALFDLTDQDVEFTLENGKPRTGDKQGTKWTIAKGGYPGDPREVYGLNATARPPLMKGAPMPLDDRSDAINRAVALKAAANWCIDDADGTPDRVLAVADRFLSWLTPAAGPSSSGVSGPEARDDGEGAASGPTSTSDWEGDQPTSVPAGEETLSLLRDVLGGQVSALKAARARYGPQIVRLAQLSESQADMLMELAETEPAS